MNDIKRPMINDALRLLRLYMGLSQKEVASHLQISQSLVSEIERGQKAVSLDMLDRYSHSFDVSLSKLLFFAEQLEESPAKQKGKLLIANNVLNILDKLSPRELSDGQIR